MRMRWIIVTASLAATAVQADPVFHPPGGSLTYGDGASVTQNIFANVQNPAAGATVLNVPDVNGEFRMGLLSSVGLDLEIGNFSGMNTRITNFQNNMKGTQSSLTQAQTIMNDSNQLLKDLAAQPYLAQLGLATHVPTMPLVIARRNWGGSYVLDANIGIQSKVALLNRDTQLNSVLDPATGQASYTVSNGSALYVKAGGVAQMSLGHSRPVYDFDMGRVYAGVRANLYAVGLRKTLVSAAQSSGVNTVLQDAVNKPLNYQLNGGLDVGTMFVTPRYQVGATLNNINSPSFKYDALGQNCASLPAGAERDSCYIAASFTDKINLSEKHVMNPQLRVDGAVYSESRNWVFAGGFDANPVNDLLGNPVQRVGVSAAYATRSWWKPGIRVGAHTNMVGDKLSYGSLGLTFFKVMHLDVASAFQWIKINDTTSIPRKAAINLGLDLAF